MTREEAETIILKHQFAFASMPDDVIEAINYLVKEEPRWIPVSERYPKPDDEYKFFLVTDDKDTVSVQEFYLSLDEEPQFSGMRNVVAWMTLPKPYKAESEDKSV